MSNKDQFRGKLWPTLKYCTVCWEQFLYLGYTSDPMAREGRPKCQCSIYDLYTGEKTLSATGDEIYKNPALRCEYAEAHGGKDPELLGE
jgi:hypothetical protein